MEPSRLDGSAGSVSSLPACEDARDTLPSIPLFVEDELDAIRPSFPTSDALLRAGLPRRSSTPSSIAFFVLIAGTVGGCALGALQWLGIDSTPRRSTSHTSYSAQPVSIPSAATARVSEQSPDVPNASAAEANAASVLDRAGLATTPKSPPTISRAPTTRPQARAAERLYVPSNPYADHGLTESPTLPKRL